MSTAPLTECKSCLLKRPSGLLQARIANVQISVRVCAQCAEKPENIARAFAQIGIVIA